MALGSGLTLKELQDRLEKIRRMHEHLEAKTGPVDLASEETTYSCLRCGKAFALPDGGHFYAPGDTAELICRECYLKERKVFVVPAQQEYEGMTPGKALGALDHIGVNLNLHGHLTFDTMEHGPARDTAQGFVNQIASTGRMGFIRGLYIWGPTGTGKSQLAVCIMRKLIEMGVLNDKNVVYDRARAMITQLQDRYSTGGVDEFSERRRRARLWVYDDAGTEKLTTDSFRIMEDIFDAREGKASIVTSNLSRSKLIERWGEAAAPDRFRSRLALYDPIQLTGKDRRFE